jgi:hypothetical protein
MQIAARRDGETWRSVPPRAANHLALIRRFCSIPTAADPFLHRFVQIFFWGECRTVGKANRNEKSKRARCICIRVSIATDIIDACKKSRFYRYFLQSRGGLYRCAPIARAQARTQCAMSSSRALTRALRARLYTLR